MAVQGMVHALERMRQFMQPNSPVVLIQPHKSKRPIIAITSGGRRLPVAALVNPAFQPLIEAANSAIRTVLDEGRFAHVATSHHQFRVRLNSPAELHQYLHLGARPPRFPSGGKRRMNDLWRNRRAGSQIEVTESLTVIGLRLTSGVR